MVRTGTDVRFVRVGLMVWAVLHCNWAIGFEEKQKVLHERFVGMRLARSGRLFPIHEVCARERVSDRETCNKRGQGNVIFVITCRTRH